MPPGTRRSNAIAAATTLDELAALDAQLLGKRGPLAQLKTQLGSLATIDERKQAGQALNEATTRRRRGARRPARRARRGRA